jgi:hypothetical protein
VNWPSGIGALTCVVGIVIGLWQPHWGAIKKGGGWCPMEAPGCAGTIWAGLCFGLFTFTFVLSGLFSMIPVGIFPSTEVPADVRTAFLGPRPVFRVLPFRAREAWERRTSVST